MKTIYISTILLLTALSSFGQITIGSPSPATGCPNTTHNVSISITNNLLSYPVGQTYSVNLTIKDDMGMTLTTFASTYTDGFPNGTTKTFTVPNVPFVGPMTCTVDGVFGYSWPTAGTYPQSFTYTVAYPPDLTITENPAGTLEVLTLLGGNQVNYYKDAVYGSVHHNNSGTTYTPTVSGSFTAKAYEPIAGCLSANASNAITITVSSVVDQLKGQVSVFPNPLQSDLNLSSTLLDNLSFELIDNMGKVIKSGTFTSFTSLSTEDLSKGMYTLKVSDSKAAYSTFQVVK